MKKFFHALRNLFGLETQSPENEAELRAEFKSRYHHFRQLLVHDREVHEAMVDIEEALHGDDPFDMRFVRRSVTSAGTSTFQVVRHLAALAPGRYDVLQERLKTIQANINPYISPPRKHGEGPVVIPLAQLTREHTDLAGPKMSYLGEAAGALNLSIPDGFVITAEAYRRFMAHNGLGEEILRRIQSADVEGAKHPEEALFNLSSSLQQLIVSSTPPDDVAQAIFDGMDRMARNLEAENGDGSPGDGGPGNARPENLGPQSSGVRMGAGTGRGRLRVAMRSSALGEDAEGASFAGQYESRLGVSRDEALISYATVVASKYNRQAMTYRMRKGIREEDTAMCVGVMRMVEAQAGGVAYSGGALSASDDTVGVFSTFGLPKTVVDGAADVDTFRFAREDPPRLVETIIARKEAHCVCREDEGTCRMELEEERCEQPSLTEEQARRVAVLALKLEDYFGVPQDLEWALDPAGEIFLLQSRALPRAFEDAVGEDIDPAGAENRTDPTETAPDTQDTPDPATSDATPATASATPAAQAVPTNQAASVVSATSKAPRAATDQAVSGDSVHETSGPTPEGCPGQNSNNRDTGSPSMDSMDADSQGTDTLNREAPHMEGRSATSTSALAASPTEPEAPPILTGGTTASPGKAFGVIFKARTKADLLLFPDGGILVVRQALPSWAPLIHRASGVVSEMGSVAGHLASISREFGVPALFGVKGAQDKLASGTEVTLDADGCALYAGRMERLLAGRRKRQSALRGTPVHMTLANAARHVLPLHLLDPDSPDFRQKNCRSLHDILRFCHERAVREMFSYWQDKRFPKATAKQLYHNGPKQFWVLNLDDGFTHEVDGPLIQLEEIVSIPMLALWEGMGHQPWQGPPPINASGFLSVMFQATANTSLEPSMATHYTQKNYFMISRNFASLQSRFGFHFCGAEALVGERSAENYARFQFRGGAADRSRRVLRARLVADLLQERDFRIRLHGDSLSARAEGFDIPAMERRLRALGYLIMHTRQLDMIMANRAEAERKRRELSKELDAFFIRKTEQPEKTEAIGKAEQQG